MHRTIRAIRLVWWSFLLGLSVCVSAGRSAAQPPLTTQAFTVSVNITKSIEMPGKALVKDIKIENPAIARVNPSPDARAVLITGIIPGNTTIRITDSDNHVETYEVVVQADVEYLRYMLRQVAPTATIYPIPSGNNVFILTGTVAKSEDIPIIMATAQSVVGAGVINALRVGGVVQVQLDVVIASVSRTELRAMNFSFLQNGKQHFLAGVPFAGGNAGSPATLTATNAITVPSITSSLGSTGNLALGFVNNQTSFLAFLQALRTEGLAKLVAEPRLTTMSGRPASFQSGGRLAVPEPSGLGTNAVRFENFGTQLNFLPIVLGNGKIYLEVEPIINIVDAANGTSINGTTVPGFDTQQLHTTVEMEPGQTFVLGGLLQHTVNATATKIPVLGDLPFINIFFSGKSYNEQDTELVIMITPYLVDAMACDQLPKLLPGQETRSPDDFELFLEGILEAPRGQRAVWPGHHYMAAYLNGPTGGAIPCAAHPAQGGVPCAAPGVPAGAPMMSPRMAPMPGPGEMAPAPTVLPSRYTADSQVAPVVVNRPSRGQQGQALQTPLAPPSGFGQGPVEGQ